MSALVRLVDAISEFTGKLCAWMFFAVGFFITYEILVRSDIVRAAFGTAPTIWVDEVSSIMQVWAVYLAAAYVLKHRDMVTIEVAFNDHTTAMRRVVETLGLLMALLFAGVAAYFGFQLWLKATLAGHTTDTFLAPPRWLTDAAIWLGFGLLALQALVELYRIWSQGVPAPRVEPLDDV